MNERLYETIFGDWYQHLDNANCLELLDNILPSLDVLYENSTVYPSRGKVFRAFNTLPFDKVKVVLLGQDPYHSTHTRRFRGSEGMPSEGEVLPDACGLSFLTENGYIPPSLRNMFIELQTDIRSTDYNREYKLSIAHYTPENFPFNRWVGEGVLMLNTALTVEAGNPGSHLGIWKEWSRRLIKYIVTAREDIVWILLGKKAQEPLLGYDCRKVEAAHPSPLAGGKFFGSRIYSRTNELLEKPIIW